MSILSEINKNSDLNESIRNRSSKKYRVELDRNLFTFKPKLNPKTQLLASNLLSFNERQNLHLKKHFEMVFEYI